MRVFVLCQEGAPGAATPGAHAGFGVFVSRSGSPSLLTGQQRTSRLLIVKLLPQAVLEMKYVPPAPVSKP